MNILICHPKKELLEIIGFSLESQILGATVNRSLSFGDSVNFFLEDSAIDLIIAADQDNDKFFKYLLSVNSTTPIIIISEEESQLELYPDLNILGKVHTSDVQKMLIPLVKERFKNEQQNTSDSEYCRIHTGLLTRFEPLSGDIYIRLSDIKYVKLFKTGAQFTKEDLEKYLNKKKIDYLYIKNEQTQAFLKKINVDLDNLISKTADGSPSVLETVAEVHDLVHELSSRIGFTEEVQQAAKSYVRLALKTIGKMPNLTKTLAASQMKNKNYLSSHSILLANISCSIAAKMEWPSESTFQKLVTAALFHDFLFEDPQLAKISTLDQLEALRSQLTAKEVQTILQHPIKCAEIVSNLKEMPADVDTIICQHHERPNGKGFPARINLQLIAPLSAVFIVAHDLLDALTNSKGTLHLSQFVAEKQQEYTGHVFKSILKVLDTQEP